MKYLKVTADNSCLLGEHLEGWGNEKFFPF